MSKSWFKHQDGTFTRNSNCVERDIQRAWRWPWLWWQLPGLYREWRRVFWEGHVQVDRIGRFDRVLTPIPFRIAYPNHPGLWRLDDSDDRVC